MQNVQSQATSRFHALATRRGFWVAVVLLVAFTATAAMEFRRYATSILDVQAEIQTHQTTGSQAALNEIARLNGEILAVLNARDPNAMELDALQSALDTLFVRADHIAKRIDRLADGSVLSSFDSPDDILQDGRATVSAITSLVALTDAAVSSPNAATVLQAPEVAQAIETARRAAFRYLDHTARMTGALLSQQTEKVVFLNHATMVFLTIVAVAGVVCLHMLRLEVRGRQARDKAERRADRLAYFDSLTGLANRVQFQDAVGAFLEPDAKGALVLIDLDGFKGINDRHGHAAGDAVLKQISRVIRSEAETAGGIAARLGGDEFAVFMPTDDVQGLQVFCQRLVELCGLATEFGGTSIRAGVSIGLATTTQDSKTAPKSYDRMMRVADFALYASKGAGRGRYTLYDSDLERQMVERRALLKELPLAIANGELEVFLQPKVTMATGQVLGFEALVRWRRNGKLLSPAQFISLAEDSNLIQEIDTFVLDRAVETVADWNRRHRTCFGVSANLSGVHFVNDSALPFVGASLGRHDFPAELLTLEITETVQLASWDIAERIVTDLKAMGCKISIDDFGTGYSSLVYLRTISADELKIDKSLIDEIEGSAEARFILDAVLDLADSLGLEVVVEGIEREEQRAFLHGLGCRVGQGYLFGKPLAAEEALADATYPSSKLAGGWDGTDERAHLM